MAKAGTGSMFFKVNGSFQTQNIRKGTKAGYRAIGNPGEDRLLTELLAGVNVGEVDF
jgi:hypothetical protein